MKVQEPFDVCHTMHILTWVYQQNQSKHSDDATLKIKQTRISWKGEQ